MPSRRRRVVEEIVPSAARTVSSLRDVGYELPQAIADLVDNSISAGATEVGVDLRYVADGPYVRVFDNGTGMDTGTLTEAMRYGSERRYDADDLGKFGLGLKTASTSQCRRVTVASRIAAQRARIEVRCLDLDHIEHTNRWEVLVVAPDERIPELVDPLQRTRGTVVLWQDLDRVLDYQDPFGGWARRKLLSLAEDVELHLAMVFHRFLAGEVRGRQLSIKVNGASVQPWDPFCRSESTRALEQHDIEVTGDEGAGIVRVVPYVLPKDSEFSSQEAWQRASGPLKWNRQQGFYIYRANRLIQWGGWSQMRTLDEHNKLARVALDFHPSLDPAFSINIAKARVKLPGVVRDALEPIVAEVIRLAQARYRRGESGSGRGADSSGIQSARGRSTSMSDGDRLGSASGVGRGGRASPVTNALPRAALERAAAAVGERSALDRIGMKLRETDPEVAHDLGW